MSNDNRNQEGFSLRRSGVPKKETKAELIREELSSEAISKVTHSGAPQKEQKRESRAEKSQRRGLLTQTSPPTPLLSSPSSLDTMDSPDLYRKAGEASESDDSFHHTIFSSPFSNPNSKAWRHEKGNSSTPQSSSVNSSQEKTGKRKRQNPSLSLHGGKKSPNSGGAKNNAGQAKKKKSNRTRATKKAKMTAASAIDALQEKDGEMDALRERLAEFGEPEYDFIGDPEEIEEFLEDLKGPQAFVNIMSNYAKAFGVPIIKGTGLWFSTWDGQNCFAGKETTNKLLYIQAEPPSSGLWLGPTRYTDPCKPNSLSTIGIFDQKFCNYEGHEIYEVICANDDLTIYEILTPDQFKFH